MEKFRFRAWNLILDNYKHGEKAVLIVKNRGCDDSYFDATTPEALMTSALHVLNERFEEGFYDLDESEDQSNILTKEYVDSIPDPELKAFAEAKLKNQSRELSKKAEEIRIHNEIKEVLKDKNGAKAFCILREEDFSTFQLAWLETV